MNSAKELAYGLEKQGIEARFPAEARSTFLFLKVSTPALGKKHPVIQMAFFPRGKSGLGVKMSTELHLVPRLRIRKINKNKISL
jgi:hypothetical protein